MHGCTPAVLVRRNLHVAYTERPRADMLTRALILTRTFSHRRCRAASAHVFANVTGRIGPLQETSNRDTGRPSFPVPICLQTLALQLLSIAGITRRHWV